MNKTTLAAEILKELHYLPEGIEKVRTGEIMYSVEPFGLLYDLTPSMQKIVQKLQETGLFVFAVIRGTYAMSDGDRMEAASYLYVQ